jgi:DNA gyrase subunit A
MSDDNNNQEPEELEEPSEEQPSEDEIQENAELALEIESDNSAAMVFTEADGNIFSRGLVTEIEESYLSYAMSVIVSRALPDVRDGLKPVHRRILYAMHENGLRAGAKFRKSATVVGAVLGKYHPHGDTAVYDSMVRMAQDFSLRYPLVNGQGNFGSIDGDNAAAMRYTEAKMTKVAELMLGDIEKDTVDFRPNYDASAQEPSVLPTCVPQLLLNGTMGIAVGMATNIPPHNLEEVLKATRRLLRNPDATIDNLLEDIKGPDFPTGAEIYDGGAVKEMYHTGRGGIIMRAKSELEEMKNGRMSIIITEIPYQVNKSELIIKIADLVRDKKLVGISDLRDESNREGMRIVIELKKDAFPKKILNQLYKDTVLQKSFNLNMIALVDGIHPRLLNLKEVLEYFLVHRFEVIVRRTQYDLRIAQARAHILEGLKIALDHIDEVIKIIRAAATKEDAGEELIKKFGLSDLQAKAILEMRLQTLAGLERQKIEDELAEKMKLIAELQSILDSRDKQADIIEEELIEVTTKFGNGRNTLVHPYALGKFSAKDTIPDEEMLVVLTEQNYIKRMSPSVFRAQRRGGVGVVGNKMKDEDIIAKSVYGTNHNDLLFFTNLGRVFNLPMYEIPEAGRTAKGTPVVNLLQLQPDEKVTEILNLSRSEGQYIVMCTTGGTIKKSDLELFKNIRRSGLIACGVKEGETLQWARMSSGEDHIFIVTREGKSIRFPEAGVRPMGRAAAGVRGIRLKDKDHVIQMDILHPESPAKLLTVMENGLGKMSKVAEYREQSRGGSGVKVANLNAKTGKVAGARVISEGMKGDLLIVTKNGQTLRTPLQGIKTAGRATQGVILMKNKKDQVSSISIIHDEEIEVDLMEGTTEPGVDPTEAEPLEIKVMGEES